MLQLSPMYLTRSHSLRWFTCLLTLFAIGATQSTLVAAGAAKSSEEQPLYSPPKKITPRARVGGDARGTHTGSGCYFLGR
jgi:hypothetical protein